MSVPICRTALGSALLWVALLPTVQSAGLACPEAPEIEAPMLMGTWSVQTWPAQSAAAQSGDAPWTLVLGPHPEYAGTLKGLLRRNAARHLVVADWDDQALTMEESEDGRRIAATWVMQAVPGQCGRTLEGVRFTGPEPDERATRTRWTRLR
jgi:hypothetical protein